MNSVYEFFYMDGDGIFVWSCYGFTLLVLGANIVFARRTYKAMIQNIKSVQVRNP